MINSKKYRSTFSLSWSKEYQFCTASDGRGGVGHIENHLSPQKIDFRTDMDGMVFRSYKCHYAAPPLISSFNRDYAFGGSINSSIGVADADADVRVAVVYRNTHLSYQKYDF